MLERGSDLKNLLHARAHGPAAHQDDDVAGLDAVRSMTLDRADGGGLSVEHARRAGLAVDAIGIHDTRIDGRALDYRTARREIAERKSDGRGQAAFACA